MKNAGFVYKETGFAGRQELKSAAIVSKCGFCVQRMFDYIEDSYEHETAELFRTSGVREQVL